ncbi:hypothetical protein [Lentzea sp. CC55]|uniref:hypothetical protein n=1 Tax=Lentzea sp. CC55 TaxID=2884909 RepID=UPI001F240FAC|nr:hypothetical protein [Lentzea sp. CC55]MCG8927334.1 hypothetical protein [Lentzea sp. CC55]
MPDLSPAPPAFSAADRLSTRILEQAVDPIDVTMEATTPDRVAACRTFMVGRLAADDSIYGSSRFGLSVALPGHGDSNGQCEDVLAHLPAAKAAINRFLSFAPRC